MDDLEQNCDNPSALAIELPQSWHIYWHFISLLQNKLSHVIEIIPHGIYLLYTVSTMGADDLETQGVRVSAAMVLT